MIGLISRFIFLGVFTVFFLLAVGLAGTPFVYAISAFFEHLYSYYPLFQDALYAAQHTLPWLNEFSYVFVSVGWLILVFLAAAVTLWVFSAISGSDMTSLTKKK